MDTSRRAKPLKMRPDPRRKNFCAGCHIPGFPARHCQCSKHGETTMTPKLNPFAAAPELMKKWQGTSMSIAASLEPALVHLVEIRASQINGCANCLNMHTVFAREKGETEQRINLLAAWREAPCYSERE